jgi:ABC-2 type transport system permease protein
MRALTAELSCELKKLLRDPAFLLPSFGFPIGFFVLFTAVVPFARGPEVLLAATANYGAFGAMAAAMFAASIQLAQERDFGVFALKSTTPLGLSRYLFAKLLAATLFALLIALSVLALGLILHPISIGFGEALGYFASNTLAAAAFAAVGAAIGARFATNATPVIVNLVMMPLAFLGGLLLPLNMMPRAIRAIGEWLPSYFHGLLNRTALGPAELSFAELALAVGLLLVLAALCHGLAYRRLKV